MDSKSMDSYQSVTLKSSPESRVDMSGTSESAPFLFLLLEGERLEGGSARHCLSNIDEVSIGRGPTRRCRREAKDGKRQLRIDVPDRWMSTQHARILCAGEHFSFEDLSSTNGSFLDGQAVGKCALSGGSLLRLGRTFFALREALPTFALTEGDLDYHTLDGSPTGWQTLLPRLSVQLQQLGSIARTGVPVMLLGETGTGKDLLAQAIHARSGRPGKFVPVNCGALPKSLLEAQLFGHVRGAFSGAIRDEPGYLRSADRGTLFLDEIGDLPLDSQVALLRAIQNNEVVPVGSTRAVSVDLRVVCATHAPLRELVEAGTFRADLHARLGGFTFRVPPLRDRMEDFGVILARLLDELKPTSSPTAMDPEAVTALLNHSWPYNARGLRQCLASALALANGDRIQLSHLSEEIIIEPEHPSSDRAPQRLPEPDLKALLIRRFEEHEGNVTQVARSMGKARVQIQRWMKRFEIDPGEYR